MRTMLLGMLAMLLPVATMRGADDAPLTLKLVAKKDKYAWDRDRAPKEFHAAIVDAIKQTKDGKIVQFPPASSVDFVLQITNTSKKAVPINVQGDVNVFTLELKGPSVLTAMPPIAFTADFKMPKQVVIEAGKTYDIPVQKLTDGFRGASRYIYFTAPGEYTLSATYQLATAEGEKAGLLKSEAIKIVVEEPKK